MGADAVHMQLTVRPAPSPQVLRLGGSFVQISGQFRPVISCSLLYQPLFLRDNPPSLWIEGKLSQHCSCPKTLELVVVGSRQ